MTQPNIPLLESPHRTNEPTSRLTLILFLFNCGMLFFSYICLLIAGLHTYEADANLHHRFRGCTMGIEPPTLVERIMDGIEAAIVYVIYHHSLLALLFLFVMILVGVYFVFVKIREDYWRVRVLIVVGGVVGYLSVQAFSSFIGYPFLDF